MLGRLLVFALFFTILHSSCVVSDQDISTEVHCADDRYQTENVILVVVDGPRWSETWGHPTMAYMPYFRDSLSSKGVLITEFYNHGNTFTVPGHIALTTGSYDFKTNDGEQYPQNPSIFQSFLSCSGLSDLDAYLVTAKEKLKVLGDCESLTFRNSYRPGMYTHALTDRAVLNRAIATLEESAPRLLMIHFKGPDANGHAKNWEGYLEAIQTCDQLIYKLYQFLDNSPIYRGKTSLLVTNDHGRHLDGIADGFVSHGDHCAGCKHISFFAMGPDFKQGVQSDLPGESIDVMPTIGALLGFQTSWTDGRILTEIFTD